MLGPMFANTSYLDRRRVIRWSRIILTTQSYLHKNYHLHHNLREEGFEETFPLDSSRIITFLDEELVELVLVVVLRHTISH